MTGLIPLGDYWAGRSGAKSLGMKAVAISLADIWTTCRAALSRDETEGCAEQLVLNQLFVRQTMPPVVALLVKLKCA